MEKKPSKVWITENLSLSNQAMRRDIKFKKITPKNQNVTDNTEQYSNIISYN